jgi:hypothetical protein
LDASAYNAFLRAASLELDSGEALREVGRRIQAAGGEAPRRKLVRQLARAFEYVTARPHVFTRTDPLIRPAYLPAKLTAVADKLRHQVDDNFFIARSPFTTWNGSPAGFLHKLFRAGEKVVVFDEFKSQGCDVWAHPGAIGDLSTLDYLAENRANVWFLCNPVDGQDHLNPRQDTVSRRSEESVTAFRYAVIESDEAPRSLWLKALARLPLPIASIVDSGGSSIHALFRVDATSKADWDEAVAKLKAPLTRLGADPQAMTAVRLTRLANCIRGETGRLQKLLYLNAEPDETPICELAVLREVEHGA